MTTTGKSLAVVTGASAGLGTGFAEALAARGVPLLLVARRADRLDALAARLRATARVEVDTHVADLADTGQVATLADRLRALPVSTLVNNAGSGLAGRFHTLPLDRQLAMVQLNCSALLALTHAVLPGMIERRGGGVLNVASTAAFQPGPGMAVYCATKAFVLSWSEALYEELRGTGVRVTALCPGATHTEFAGEAGMADSPLFKRMATGPETVIRDGLAALDAGEAVRVSGAMNKAMTASVRFTPRGLVRRLGARLMLH